MLRFLVTAATALAMTAAPTIATAQRAPAPVPAAAEIQPSSEDVDGSALRKTSFIIPLAILVAIILALLLTQKEETQDFPTSP